MRNASIIIIQRSFCCFPTLHYVIRQRSNECKHKHIPGTARPLPSTDFRCRPCTRLYETPLYYDERFPSVGVLFFFFYDVKKLPCNALGGSTYTHNNRLRILYTHVINVLYNHRDEVKTKMHFFIWKTRLVDVVSRHCAYVRLLHSSRIPPPPTENEIIIKKI